MFAKYIAEQKRFAFSESDNGGAEIENQQYEYLFSDPTKVIVPDANGLPVLINPVLPVPQVVTMRQARQALLAAGMYTAVQVAVASASEAVRIDWEFAATVERNSPTVALLASSLGLTPQQMDDLFTAAGGL